jgi:hypothetical protein
MHPAVALRYPFLSLDQAAFFLGVSSEEAQERYDARLIPRAVSVDGGVFSPVQGLTLVPYLAFHEQVGDDVRTQLAAWQDGQLEVPAKLNSAQRAGVESTRKTSVSATANGGGG